MKNIRFSQTVSIKNFNKSLCKNLYEQATDLSLHDKVSEIYGLIEQEDYELSLMYLARLREQLELFSMVVEDTQQNITSFIEINNDTKETQPVEEKQAEVIQSAQNQKDPLEQLQQIEKLVNVVKNLKGEQT